MPLKHLRMTQALVPEGLLNHCEGLHSTFHKIGTKFDAHSLFLSLIHCENCHMSYCTTPNKHVCKLPTSTQLHATWHTDSLDMVVLPSAGASCYHNCCIDGGTSLENFGYHLILWLVSDHSHAHHCSYHLLEDIAYWSTCLHVTCLSFSTLAVKSPPFLVLMSPHL